ncbi:MAG: DUF4488 domain-containing protein [Bacteroidota bacterium]
MKTNLKFITALLCFYFTITTAFAQHSDTPRSVRASQAAQAKAAFIGVWELFKMADNGQPLRDYPPGYLKIFNEDGTFIIIRVQKGGSIIKQSGYYVIDDDQVFREAPKLEEMQTKGIKISYELSKDNKVFTIGFSYPDGSAFTEAYRRVEYQNR